MSKVKKLLHTRYRVNDLERTVKFYRDVLGLTEVCRHKSPRGSELVFLKVPGSEELIELCCFPASGPVRYFSSTSCRRAASSSPRFRTNSIGFCDKN